MAKGDLSKPILVEESLPYGEDHYETLPMDPESVNAAIARFSEEQPEWDETKESEGLVALTST